MLKRKKSQFKAKRRLANVAAIRRRLKRFSTINKLHQRRRHYYNFFSQAAHGA